jgi:ADP-heptose:LPS heptosyltransferase
MTAAKCFVTVNTGLLWLACMNSVKTVVVDTFTDFEWNPALYSNVTRLSHDYDEEGKSLHLVTKHHEDGTYFESMYRVTPEEVSDAINRVV